MRPTIFDQASPDESGMPFFSHGLRFLESGVFSAWYRNRVCENRINAGFVASEGELWQPGFDQEMQEAIELEEVLQRALQHREVRLLERLRLRGLERTDAFRPRSLNW